MRTSTILTIISLLIGFSFTAQSTIHEVRVSNILNPDTSTNVFVGDTMRWIWESEGHSMMIGVVPNGVSPYYFQLNSSEPVHDYVITVAGEYSYTCYPHGNFQGYFNAQEAVGIAKEPKGSFNLFPNPSTNQISLTGNFIDFNDEVVIYDVTGREVKREQIKLRDKHLLNLSGQASGIYFLKVERNKEVLFEEKIVKL